MPPAEPVAKQRELIESGPQSPAIQCSPADRHGTSPRLRRSVRSVGARPERDIGNDVGGRRNAAPSYRAELGSEPSNDRQKSMQRAVVVICTHPS